MASPYSIGKIKIKIVVGCLLAVLTITIAGRFTYQSFNQMVRAMDSIGQPKTKLLHLNQILSDISNAEGSMRAYTLTNKSQYLSQYWKQFYQVEQQIQSLKLEMPLHSQQYIQLDSVEQLLREKQEKMRTFLALKEQERQAASYQKAIARIENTAKDTLQSVPKINTTMEATATLTPALPKLVKKNEFTKLTEMFSASPYPSASAATSTSDYYVAHTAPPQVKTELKATHDLVAPSVKETTDPLLRDLKTIIREIKEEATQFEHELGEQELALIERDWLIIHQIRSIIQSVRREEMALSQQNAQQARDIAKQASLTIILIGLIVILGSIVFLIVVLKDLTRSSYYRKSLLRAKRQAEALAQAKEDFLANMSHEIRTPLNAITGFLEQLKKTSLDGNQRFFVQTVESSSDHLLSIVNDILDLSKIASGKLEIEQQPFSVKKVVQTVVDVLRVQAQAKEITISREIDPALDRLLEGDAHRLRQVLFNLIGNAVKFTEQGGVFIQVTAQEATQESVLVHFVVKDTGVGIAKDKLGYVFGAFNQDQSVAKRFGGTGLGLSICKKLVELQGGTISVESQVGVGSAFSFTIRYTKAQATAAVAQDTPKVHSLQDRAILMVDDDPVNRLLLEVMFRKWETEIDIVESGADALLRLTHRSYDMVLTDIQMPEMNGVMLMHLIKEKQPQLPVIAFTATAQRHTLESYLAEGFDDYLLKPFKEEEILKKIGQYLNADADEPCYAPVSSVATTTAAYSLNNLLQITKNNHAVVISILEVLIRNARKDVRKLVEAATHQQWSEVGALAHKLKSGFGQVEAISTMTLLKEIEEQVEHQALDDVAEKVAQVAQQAHHLFAALEQEIRDQVTATTA